MRSLCVCFLWSAVWAICFSHRARFVEFVESKFGELFSLKKLNHHCKTALCIYSSYFFKWFFLILKFFDYLKHVSVTYVCMPLARRDSRWW